MMSGEMQPEQAVERATASADRFRPTRCGGGIHMQNRAVLVLLWVLLCWRSSGHGSDVYSTFFPKLKEYLAANPAALKALTNSFSEVFASKTVRVFYFYDNDEDEAEARAFHTYPEASVVWIAVRENQESCDQFITLFFEVMNAKNEDKFRKLFRDAHAKSVSKDEFARQILRAEFDAVKRTRDVLRTLNLSEKDRAESYYYNRFDQCPNKFEDFLAYAKRVSPGRDVLKEYEAKYDALRQTP